MLVVFLQIVPGSQNTVAIDLIVTHVRRQLGERALSHRKTLTSINGCQKDSSGHEILPPTVTVMEQTPQLIVSCVREVSEFTLCLIYNGQL